MSNFHWPKRRPTALCPHSPNATSTRPFITALIPLTVLFAGAVLVSLLTFSGAHAQSPEPGYDEREAQHIDRMIMCPVCPAETIDQAQVEISFQMRGLVREMLAEGHTRQEILDFFVARYGPDILAAPPKSGVNLLAWILPIVGVLAGLIGVYFVIRGMTNRDKGPEPAFADGPSADELAPYLELVDQQLGLDRASRAAPPIVEHTGEGPPVGPDDKNGTAIDG